ncbi:hypothetical protein KAX75_09605, partial [candidate division WOR-3 bacterium]|nr:hypothetical protein [candidate division WOR-3 bacterium]
MRLSFLIKNKKALFVIFCSALVFRVIFSLPVFFDTERALGPGSDARNYTVLAEHMLTKFEFSVYPEETGYHEAARTPVY